MNEVRCVVEEAFGLSESPRWHDNEQALYWVDTYRPSIERLDPATGARRTFAMPERIGCFSFCGDGRVIAGMQSGIAFVELESGTMESLFDLEPDHSQSRFNDGRCDPRGRFWVGSVVETMDRRTNALFRYDADGTCRKMVGDLICPNGLAFSPDGSILYHSDSRQEHVWAWDLDGANGDISNRRVFIDFDGREGRPDGAAVDAEGYYWICCIGAWHVRRYAPDGTIDRVVGVPVQRPTACAFGGPGLDTLYVTSATLPLPEDVLAVQPLAGSVFAVDVGVKGLAEPRFHIPPG